MKLFWKIFVAVFISFLVVISFISYVLTVKQVSDWKDHILAQNGVIASFISKEIEKGYQESRWPFESLRRLSEQEDFLFWWVVRDDGAIHLANDASLMRTYASEYFPEIANARDENVFLNRNQNYGILVKSLEVGEKKWSFWLGFSLRRLLEVRKQIVFLVVVSSMSALAMFGLTLYFLTRHFTKPIKDLTVGAATIGEGDLTHRVKIKSKDELGELANSFNKMTEDLDRITVSKDYLSSVIDSMIDSLVVVDQDLKISTVNKATCKLLEYKEEDLIGRLVEIVFATGEDTPFTGTKLKNLIEGGEVSSYETYWQAKDGKKVLVLFNCSVMKNEYGDMISIVCTARDITERKRTEKKLKQIMAELERSNAELEEFAYVTSHDLQEPLRMVSSYLQLLERRYQGRLDSEADEFIAYAVDGATRMRDMINDLLDYSRVDTRGKHFEPTDCEAVLDRTLENLKMVVEESGAVVSHDPLPTVMADNVQLIQLFQNLIGNAIKFCGKEPPRIHILAEQKGKEWVFSVRDNGIGIDPEYAERIFQIFQRLHSRKEYPGTGIGLAICRRIVERHGGHIWVKSQPGTGSTFYFTIPIKD